MNNSQKVAELIESLAKDRGVSVSTMLSELGMNKNALFTMKNSGYLPRIENLTKFADYFNVTVDFLLGRPSSGNKEVEMILSLSKEDKEFIMRQVRILLLDKKAS